MCLLDDHKNLSKRASMCFIMVCQCNDSDFVHAFHTKGKMVKLSWALVPLLSCSPLKYERDTVVCIHRRPIEIGNLSNMRMALSFSFILVSLFARRCFFFFLLSHYEISFGEAVDANQLYLGGYYFQQCDTDKLIKYSLAVWMVQARSHSTQSLFLPFVVIRLFLIAATSNNVFVCMSESQ